MSDDPEPTEDTATPCPHYVGNASAKCRFVLFSGEDADDTTQIWVIRDEEWRNFDWCATAHNEISASSFHAVYGNTRVGPLMWQ